MPRLIRGVLLTCALLALGGEARAGFIFTGFDIRGDFWPEGISSSGQMVGIGPGGPSLLLSGGSYTPLPLPAGGFAYGINASGQIVAADQFHSYLLSGGSLTRLDFPGARATWARGINDLGQIVGTYLDADGRADHGFLLSGGSYTSLDVPGALQTQVVGINSSGQIVGGYDDFLGRDHAFLLDKGVYADLNVPGATESYATGISNSGFIVGSYDNGQVFLTRGGSFLPFAVPGSTLTLPTGIRDPTQVVGLYADGAGEAHGFLATRVLSPEPATWALLAVGAVGLLGHGWRRRKARAVE